MLAEHDHKARLLELNAPWACAWPVIVADPPWQFGDALGDRGAAANYDTMSALDIARLEPRVADDAVLFLWRVASMQQEAFEVMRAWGFDLKTELVWVKATARGRRHFGMGRIFRAEHEVCLVGVRGKPKVLRHDVRSTFTAQVGRHSEKPEAFFGIVERMYRGPYLEMFARRRREGWTPWGREAPREERRG